MTRHGVARPVVKGTTNQSDDESERRAATVGCWFLTLLDERPVLAPKPTQLLALIGAQAGGLALADMTVFPTARHLASWASRCPGNHQSAGWRRCGRTRRGSKWLAIALEEAALAAIRTRDSNLQAQHKRLKPRLGYGRALGAVKHSMLIAYLAHVHHRPDLPRPRRRLLPTPRPERHTKRLIAKLEALGHHVTLQPAAP